ncbi:hypothetical protein GCM10018790_11500 [Kitasatospora xanthocidica]|uniref:hypothetical protein n=1 Tax=Kitasatospora xanthocidica TaxID=83382 RepID=UPI0016722473|nr:hypothetical protein [Kitasatospora xanthocidica]GHF35410.1 hypothetical protein GCM10018790_11500 [Kitasatospora xanthocidica]
MGEQGETHNSVRDATVHGPVVQGGNVWVLFVSGRGPLLVLATVMALVAAVGTYLVLDRGAAPEPTLTAHYTLGDGAIEGNMVLDRPLGATGIPASVVGCEATWSWMHGQGGVDVGTAHLVVEATGGGDRTVAIHGVRATVVGTPQDPPTGTAAYCPPQGVGSAVALGIDLDSDDRVALIADSMGAVSYAPFFTGKYLYLEDRKPEVVNLSVLAARKSYEFVLTVDGTVDGERRTWTLQDGDRPFRVTGVRPGLTTSLRGQAEGWATVYGRQVGTPVRCNPCSDGNEQIPGTSVAAAPKEQAPPPPLPVARPATPVPPLVVLPKDPESVALAWVIAGNSIDVRRGDTGLASVVPRMKPYMTKAMAVRGEGGADRVDNPVWPPEVTERKGWLVVTSAEAYLPPGGRVPPGERTEDTVRLRVDSEVTYYTDDGWSQVARGQFGGTVTLRRQPDGTYLVDDYGP